MNKDELELVTEDGLLLTENIVKAGQGLVKEISGNSGKYIESIITIGISKRLLESNREYIGIYYDLSKMIPEVDSRGFKVKFIIVA